MPIWEARERECLPCACRWYLIADRLAGPSKQDSEDVLSRHRSQGNRVLTKEHLEEVVLDPTGFKPFTLDTPF